VRLMKHQVLGNQHDLIIAGSSLAPSIDRPTLVTRAFTSLTPIHHRTTTNRMPS
jgi:hypothetical protein